MTNVVGPNTPGAVEVTVWDLEMTTDPGIAAPQRTDLVLMQATEPAPELARFFYGEVGRDFNWRGRWEWTRDQWAAEADNPDHHMFTCWSGGAPAGYFTLDEHTQDTTGNTELVHFGLLPRFHGRGIGKWLLSAVIEQAWALPSTHRLWLHTCSLDGPNAMANYLARGFEVCGERTEWQLLIPAP